MCCRRRPTLDLVVTSRTLGLPVAFDRNGQCSCDFYRIGYPMKSLGSPTNLIAPPRQIVIFLPALCRKMGIPYCVVKV